MSGISPTVIVAVLSALVVLTGVVLYLVLGRRREEDDGSDSSGDLLRLEAPPKPRPAAATPVPVAAEAVPPAPPAGSPSEALAASGDDSDLARLHEKAKRRARTVVREIMMYNEEKLEKGRREGNIIKYLGREIELSRKLYQASIELSDTDSGRYFDESLLSILAAGDARLLEED